jgi:hypothetical protein
MADRMRRYLADLHYWRSQLKGFRGLNFVQSVVYVGRRRWKNPPTRIVEGRLTFEYRHDRSGAAASK